MQIEVESDTYAKVRELLTQAATQLGSSKGTVSSAVPSSSFGLIGAFVPPAINSLGAVFETASAAAATVTTTAATGIDSTIKEFQRIEESGSADLGRIGSAS